MVEVHFLWVVFAFIAGLALGALLRGQRGSSTPTRFQPPRKGEVLPSSVINGRNFG